MYGAAKTDKIKHKRLLINKKDAALGQHLFGGCLRTRTSRGLLLYLAQLTLRSPLSILLQHPEPPVGTIPRTPITPIQINTIKSRPFISNLISIPFLNFLAIVKDKVESNHNRPQIKDYERRRILRRLWQHMIIMLRSVLVSHSFKSEVKLCGKCETLPCK